MLKSNFVYLLAAVAVVIGLCLYNPFILYFQNDDLVHIPLSRDCVLLQHNSFRPVCDIFMMLDYRVWGKEAWGYHFTNLLLHIANTIFVYRLTILVAKKYNISNNISIPALLTSVLFFIYANHSEAVFWILGRSGMLGMLFFLPACICYLKRENNIFFSASVVFSLLAWLSYESSFILIIVFTAISIIDVRKEISSVKKESKFLLFSFFAFIMYMVSRYYFTGELLGSYEAGALQNNQFILLAENFVKLLIRSVTPYALDSKILLLHFALISIVLVYTILKQEKQLKNTILVLGFLWLISLLPYISLGIDTKGTESERFLYLPSFFICFIIVLLISNTSNRLLKSIAFFVLFGIELFILFENSKRYHYAGNVVKTTISEINKLKNKNNLLIESLPEEDGGALIFRTGFPEGVNWLKNKNTVDSLMVVSRHHTDYPVSKSFIVQRSNDVSLITNLFLKNNVSANDVVFRYTDSSLQVISINK